MWQWLLTGAGAPNNAERRDRSDHEASDSDD
jgi:hypothetical protein